MCVCKRGGEQALTRSLWEFDRSQGILGIKLCF